MQFANIEGDYLDEEEDLYFKYSAYVFINSKKEITRVDFKRIKCEDNLGNDVEIKQKWFDILTDHIITRVEESL